MSAVIKFPEIVKLDPKRFTDKDFSILVKFYRDLLISVIIRNIISEEIK